MADHPGPWSFNCQCWLPSIPQSILHHLAPVGLLLTIPFLIPTQHLLEAQFLPAKFLG